MKNLIIITLTLAAGTAIGIVAPTWGDCAKLVGAGICCFAAGLMFARTKTEWSAVKPAKTKTRSAGVKLPKGKKVYENRN
jgi:hypothetical protein